MVRETRHLWVGNLPENIREERIREHFKRYGRVQSVKLLPGSNGSLCAAVAFMDIKSASKAHNCEHTLDEHALSTEYYEPGPYTSSQQRFPIGIADEHSTFERTSHFYERSGGSTPGTPISSSGSRTEVDGYLRRSSVYHTAPDPLRGRPRERPYRNGPTYPPGTERFFIHGPGMLYDGQLHLHLVRWIPSEVSSCSNNRRNWVYDTGSVRYLTASSDEHGTGKSTTKKVRSGSESRSGSQSSRSRSPTRSSTGSPRSSDSSTRSDSPRSSTRVSVQSAVAPPAQQAPSSTTLAVYSEDRRPLAICVRNLPTRSSDTSLKDGLFHEYKKHGKVTWVKVVGAANDRYALVCFKKPEDVEKAIEVSQDKLFFGCKIDVAPYHGYDVEDNEARPYDTELDEYHPKATRTLFIGNLEKDVTAGDIRQHFDQFGEIIEIDIKKQPGVTSSYAFCQYADIGSVVQAMRTLDGEPLGESRLKLGFGKSMASSCVWIAGVAEQVSDKYLDLQFRKFGPVSHVIVDRERGQALIFFEQVSAAAAAVKEMRGVPIRGNRIQIDFASRECQEAFYERIDSRDPNWTSFETNSRSDRDGVSSRYDPRYRYDASRVRSSSYSRSSGSRTPRRHEVFDSPRYKSYEELSPTSDHEESVGDSTDLKHLHKERNHLQHLLDQLDRPLRSVTAADQGLVVTTHNHRRRLSSSSHQRPSGEGPAAPLSKRRKTGSTSEDERKRHHHQSGDESRPGTPLFDEKPDNIQPQEPRRAPRERPEEPLSLPLPQFAAHCFSTTPKPPPPTTTTTTTTTSTPTSNLTHLTSGHPAPPTSPVRPPSPSSTSSSEVSPQSPTLEERIRSLDEKYEKWTGRTQQQPPVKPKHRLLDVDVRELQPSDIVKSVLAKPSVFDDDSKRLENFGEKYEPREFSSFSRSVGGLDVVPRYVPGDPRNPSYIPNLSVKVSPLNSPSGALLSPCPAAKGLQYPFPSHPPVQPTTSVATTTAGSSSPPAASVVRPISKSMEFSVLKAESWLGINKSGDGPFQKDSIISAGGFAQRFNMHSKALESSSAQRHNVMKLTDLATQKMDIPSQKSLDPRLEKMNAGLTTMTTSVLSQRLAVKSDSNKGELICLKYSNSMISSNSNTSNKISSSASSGGGGGSGTSSSHNNHTINNNSASNSNSNSNNTSSNNNNNDGNSTRSASLTGSIHSKSNHNNNVDKSDSFNGNSISGGRRDDAEISVIRHLKGEEARGSSGIECGRRSRGNSLGSRSDEMTSKSGSEYCGRSSKVVVDNDIQVISEFFRGERVSHTSEISVLETRGTSKGNRVVGPESFSIFSSDNNKSKVVVKEPTDGCSSVVQNCESTSTKKLESSCLKSNVSHSKTANVILGESEVLPRSQLSQDVVGKLTGNGSSAKTGDITASKISDSSVKLLNENDKLITNKSASVHKDEFVPFNVRDKESGSGSGGGGGGGEHIEKVVKSSSSSGRERERERDRDRDREREKERERHGDRDRSSRDERSGRDLEKDRSSRDKVAAERDRDRDKSVRDRQRDRDVPESVDKERKKDREVETERKKDRESMDVIEREKRKENDLDKDRKKEQSDVLDRRKDGSDKKSQDSSERSKKRDEEKEKEKEREKEKDKKKDRDTSEKRKDSHSSDKHKRNNEHEKRRESESDQKDRKKDKTSSSSSQPLIIGSKRRISSQDSAEGLEDAKRSKSEHKRRDSKDSKSSSFSNVSSSSSSNNKLIKTDQKSSESKSSSSSSSSSRDSKHKHSSESSSSQKSSESKAQDHKRREDSDRRKSQGDISEKKKEKEKEKEKERDKDKDKDNYKDKEKDREKDGKKSQVKSEEVVKNSHDYNGRSIRESEKHGSTDVPEETQKKHSHSHRKESRESRESRESKDSKDSTKDSKDSKERKKSVKQEFGSTESLEDKKVQRKEKKSSGDKKKEEVSEVKHAKDKLKMETKKENGHDSESDSDSEPKKHSIFDVVLDEPAYISMYDKVKARSCKNMQKQEEEKRQVKLKEKFNQLKQSRAKREEKKRSTSWDEDSDSDESQIRRIPRRSFSRLSSDDEGVTTTMKREKKSSESWSTDKRSKKSYDTSEDEGIKMKTVLHTSDVYSDDSDAGFAENGDKSHKFRAKSKSKNVFDSSEEETIKRPRRENLVAPKDTFHSVSKPEKIGGIDCKNKVRLSLDSSTDRFCHESKAKKRTPTESMSEGEPSYHHHHHHHHSSKSSDKVDRKKSKKKDKRQKSMEEDSKSGEGDFTLTEKTESEHKSSKEEKKERRKSLQSGNEDNEDNSKHKKSSSSSSSSKSSKGGPQYDLVIAKNEDHKYERIFDDFSDESNDRLLQLKAAESAKTKWQVAQVYGTDSDSNIDAGEHMSSGKLRKSKDKKKRDKRNREHSVELLEAGRALEKMLSSPSSRRNSVDMLKYCGDSAEDFGDIKLNKEKKKKRKKSKDEKSSRHHHHHHHSSSEKNETVAPESKPVMTSSASVPHVSPSLPSLLDMPSSPSGIKQEPPSPISPRVPTATNSKTQEKMIPGFGYEMDEKMHESAVQSIAMLDVTPKTEPKVDTKDIIIIEDTIEKKDENKERAVISQEETEDAVAALLGETFTYSSCFEGNSPVETDPEPHDEEEMRQAVQSLNESKPDTPQSESGLQIDTDAEDQDEQFTGLRFESIPRTPDLDLSQPPKTPDIQPSYEAKPAVPFARKDTTRNSREEMEVPIVSPPSPDSLVSYENDECEPAKEKDVDLKPPILRPASPKLFKDESPPIIEPVSSMGSSERIYMDNRLLLHPPPLIPVAKQIATSPPKPSPSLSIVRPIMSLSTSTASTLVLTSMRAATPLTTTISSSTISRKTFTIATTSSSIITTRATIQPPVLSPVTPSALTSPIRLSPSTTEPSNMSAASRFSTPATMVTSQHVPGHLLPQKIILQQVPRPTPTRVVTTPASVVKVADSVLSVQPTVSSGGDMPALTLPEPVKPTQTTLSTQTSPPPPLGLEVGSTSTPSFEKPRPELVTAQPASVISVLSRSLPVPVPPQPYSRITTIATTTTAGAAVETPASSSTSLMVSATSVQTLTTSVISVHTAATETKKIVLNCQNVTHPEVLPTPKVVSVSSVQSTVVPEVAATPPPPRPPSVPAPVIATVSAPAPTHIPTSPVSTPAPTSTPVATPIPNPIPEVKAPEPETVLAVPPRPSSVIETKVSEGKNNDEVQLTEVKNRVPEKEKAEEDKRSVMQKEPIEHAAVAEPEEPKHKEKVNSEDHSVIRQPQSQQHDNVFKSTSLPSVEVIELSESVIKKVDSVSSLKSEESINENADVSDKHDTSSSTNLDDSMRSLSSEEENKQVNSITTRKGRKKGNRGGMVTRKAKQGTVNKVESPVSKRGGKAQKVGKTVNDLGKKQSKDVYEFHDESDEDGGGEKERPRLILTIKSPNSVKDQPVVPPKPAAAPNKSPNPAKSPKEGGLSAKSPEQKAPVIEKDIGAMNTRKSRRLLEKDGYRNTVDDVIEDVVRNNGTRNATSPRRSLRQVTKAANTTPVVPLPKKVMTRTAKKSIGCASTDDEMKDSEMSAAAKTAEPAFAEEKEVAPAPKTQPTIKEEPEAEGETSDEEPTTLIDPVTGMLMVMRAKEEGKYVPVPNVPPIAPPTPPPPPPPVKTEVLPIVTEGLASHWLSHETLKQQAVIKVQSYGETTNKVNPGFMNRPPTPPTTPQARIQEPVTRLPVEMMKKIAPEHILESDPIKPEPDMNKILLQPMELSKQKMCHIEPGKMYPEINRVEYADPIVRNASSEPGKIYRQVVKPTPQVPPPTLNKGLCAKGVAILASPNKQLYQNPKHIKMSPQNQILTGAVASSPPRVVKTTPPAHELHPMTGAVASPPPRAPHLTSQQPIVTGASSSRALVDAPMGPGASPRGMTIPPYEATLQTPTQTLHSPPPAHQQGEGINMGHLGHPPFVHPQLMYQQYLRAQEMLPSPYQLTASLQGKLVEERERERGAGDMGRSPPLELRTPRATDSPTVYMGRQQYTRYYDEPPPAHLHVGRHIHQAPDAPGQPRLQIATPPHASQVPPQADSLLMLLQRYPIMWQGLLALKNDQSAVQMHFVFGNPHVARDSLPCNSDGSTPPLRIAQRMRLEQTQLEGVARKMQMDNEHCMLLALPCGRDHMDVLQQSTNLQTGFITYLQQKQAAGIVNIAHPGSQQAAYVVHIFPSCEFANENLARNAPDLLHRMQEIPHLVIVIATV